MGVKGLWQLLLPIGRRISIETLEGKTLAVDASIWMIQFIKAMRDADGKVIPNAHLIGFLRRICRLLYHGIRPVIVFDGTTPQIKLREIKRRRKELRREGVPISEEEQQAAAVRMAKRILVAQLKNSKKKKSNNDQDDEADTATHTTTGRRQQQQQSNTNNVKGAFATGFFMENRGNVGDTAVASSGAQSNTEDIIDVDNNSGSYHEDENRPLEKSSMLINKRHQINADDCTDDYAIASMLQQEEYDGVVEEETGKQLLEESPKRMSGIDDEYLDENDSASNDSSFSDNGGFDDEANQGDLPELSTVLSLPPNLRKDIFEKVQRQRRLSARKQYLPVAADPIKYSQCQLSNFLQSSRLNQRITKMSKDAVSSLQQNGAEEIGEAIASDSTRRIVFIKNLPESRPSQAQPELQAATVTYSLSPKLKRLQRRRILDEDQNNNSDSDDELTKMQTCESHHLHKRKIIESNYFEDDDDKDEPLGTEFQEPAQDAKENYNDVYCNEGGFLIDSKHHLDQDRGPSNYSFMENHYETCENLDFSHEDGGGFIRDASRTPSDSHVQSLTENEAFAVEESVKSDHNHSETIDLITSEDDSSKKEEEVSLDETTRLHDAVAVDKSIDRQSEKHTITCAVGSNDFHIANEGLEVNSDSASVNSNDEVDWEDGMNDAEAQPNPTGEVTLQVDEYSGAGVSHGFDETGSVACKKHENEKHLQDSCFHSFSENQKSESYHIPHEFSDHSSVLSNDQPNYTSENATAAALVQAQATASNLTNWAGRAVRRAIEEHIGKPLPDNKFEASVPLPPSDVALSEDANLDNYGDIDNPYGTTTSSELQLNPDISLEFLEREDDALQQEQNRQQRDMDTFTESMKEDIVQLLLLFGIPYVDAPAEAEAQCVALEKLGLVDGIVTEDSDVFVFGGEKIYRNIFDELKFVELYLARDANMELGLSTNDFIALAMLLGSDYTSGVKGVGIVNGMEILQAFPVQDDLLEGLKKFRIWLDGLDITENSSNVSTNDSEVNELMHFHLKHRTARTRWVSPVDFPAGDIIAAYKKPAVDKSTKRFTWGVPDVESIQAFCSNRMGWTKEEVDKIVMPVMKNKSSMRQTRLDSFLMSYNDEIKFAKIKSARLRNVMSSIKKQGGTSKKEGTESGIQCTEESTESQSIVASNSKFIKPKKNSAKRRKK